ncbi:DUF1493 family protein [Trinickia dinghuensis]|uniref:DUF1493 family protein n=1 Tax=Trinickia dinghuensis TaxID=2291023 RepID=A0A3D8JT83_9BURK|nr:DUF1493 family protein [Trinickia dinghuensis]RDU96080.1 DUF1493 family protein [Trinickia dinghuensis]
MRGNYTWEDLESFVRREACISSKKTISAKSTVEDDLGQQGEEADEFMQHFFELFGIDRGDYDFRRYFLMEGEGILYHLTMKLLRRPHTFKREAITLGMLHSALINGKWDAEALARSATTQ